MSIFSRIYGAKRPKVYVFSDHVLQARGRALFRPVGSFWRFMPDTGGGPRRPSAGPPSPPSSDLCAPSPGPGILCAYPEAGGRIRPGRRGTLSILPDMAPVSLMSYGDLQGLPETVMEILWRRLWVRLAGEIGRPGP